MQRKMREILFRAKDKNTHEWVYGCYVRMLSAAGFVYAILVPAENPDESNTIYPIIPGTVGEYTGLTDKNGKKIFEGDIIKGVGDELFVIEWHNGQFIAKCLHDWLFMFEAKTGEIVGNIHDNPELVERESESNG